MTEYLQKCHIAVPLERVRTLLVILALGSMSLGNPSAVAQDHRIVPLRDPAYATITQLQRRGFLLDLNLTSLPYARSQVQKAIQNLDPSRLTPLEKAWLDRLAKRLGTTEGESVQGAVGVSGDIRLQAANSNRPDLSRQLESTWQGYPGIFTGIGGHYRSFAAEFGIQYDRFYGIDPETAVSERSFRPRIEDSYIGLRSTYGSILVGNVDRHWGPYAEPGLVQSSNSRSFNQVNLEIGSDLFSVSGYLGSLAWLDLPPPYPSGVRRFVAGHRFDWKPTERFGFTLLESIVYSAEEAGPMLKYLNPVQVYLVLTDNRPKNAEQNALVAGMLWFQWRNVTVYGQAMIDDIALLDRSEPLAAALAGSITVGRLFPAADAGISLLMSAARAYRAEQLEGGYHYEGRGLGLPFTDFVQTRAFLDIYPTPQLTISPTLILLAQGDGASLLGEYPPDDLPFILAGAEKITARLACGLAYAGTDFLTISADLGLNLVGTSMANLGSERRRFAGMLNLQINSGLIVNRFK